MSNSSPLADKLVFCGKTSLEIAHSFNDANIDATRSPLSALPKSPLPDPALKQLASRLSATTPPIRFSFPAHLLFHGDVRHKQTLLRIPHRCTNIPKGRHFLKVDKNVYAASANFALCQIADEAKEMLDLLLLLWEACGTYRTDLTWMESTYETAPLTSVRSLARFMSENPKIHGTGKIRRVLHYVLRRFFLSDDGVDGEIHDLVGAVVYDIKLSPFAPPQARDGSLQRIFRHSALRIYNNRKTDFTNEKSVFFEYFTGFRSHRQTRNLRRKEKVPSYGTRERGKQTLGGQFSVRGYSNRGVLVSDSR